MFNALPYHGTYNFATMPMTPQEHVLVLMMFTRQSQYIATVEEILKSKGIITADDLPAFDFAVRTDRDATALAFQGTVGQYRRFAEELGIELPAEIPPFA
jgi:hypothetical protein